MNAGLVTPDLTHLRYYVPLARLLKYLGVDVEILYDRCKNKYNGLAVEKNFNLLNDIACKHSLVLTELQNVQHTFDLVFTVESYDISSLNYSKHFVIQHGFDCIDHAKKISPQATYLVSSKMMHDYLLSNFSVKSVVVPCPIVFWDPKSYNGFKQLEQKTATVFYPDSGYQDIADRVIKIVESMHVQCFVKQRRKHQSIPDAIKHKIYDDVWYPSEAVWFPAVSNITIGFGSSAYTDLIPAGLAYLNLDLSPTTYPWNLFVHPNDLCYHKMTTFDENDFIYRLSTLLGQDGVVRFDDEKVVSFVKQVVCT